jgi:AcrR family transcriptional regulator
MVAGRPREFDYDKALEQAMNVFWQKGYEGTSMPDLTQAMGMNRPSIYAAFGNKEELFNKALNKYHEKSMVFLRERLDQPDMKEAISGFFCGIATSFSSKETPKGCFTVMSALVGSDKCQSIRDAARSRRDDILNALHDRLKKGLRDGHLPKGTDTKCLARFFVTVLQGMSVQSASGACKEDMYKIALKSLDVLRD